MKKSLIALAAMAAAGVASAQSSVTLFGILDVGYSHLSATNAGSVNLLRSDNYNSSRLGFRGTEDLGGGMSASFWLEAGLNIDTGVGANSSQNNTQVGDRIGFNTSPAAGSNTYYPQSSLRARQGLTFNRRSTVSLAGNWGELRVGRDYVPTFWNLTVFDPFGTNGVGSYNNVALGPLNPRANGAFPPGAAAPQVRSSNTIGYFLPANLGGFYGQAMYGLSEIPSNCTTVGASVQTGNGCDGANGDGRFVGARLGFASGPFNVAGAWSRTRYNDTAAIAFPALAGGTAFAGGVANNQNYVGNYTQWNVGGQWDFGMAKLLAQYGRQEVEATTVTAGANRELRHWLIGTLIPVGAGEIRLAYDRGTRDDSAGAGGNDGASIRQWAVGYVHNFSKRTAVYATYARQKLSNGAAGTAGATLGLNAGGPGNTAIAAGASTSANGYDIGIRHSF
jgi:predicted porin